MADSLKKFGMVVLLAFCARSADAAILTEITFGPFNGGSLAAVYASSDAQFSTIDAGITFATPSAALRIFGGGSGTTSWVFAGSAASPSAANTNLFDSATANFGSPTRFDIDLGFASPGNVYTITGAELVMRANNDSGARWSMGYRDGSGVAQTIGSVTPSAPAGDPTQTHLIDLSTAGLSATDSTTTFDITGSGGIRFLFYDTDADAASDNFQVQSIRLIGTVTAIPEPSSLALLGLTGLAAFVKRRYRPVA